MAKGSAPWPPSNHGLTAALGGEPRTEQISDGAANDMADGDDAIVHDDPASSVTARLADHILSERYLSKK